ncbi:hypothetical protein [Streptococcus devriesei]|uniref:hypothetical protein n=1 Tax=Streptococcus devriesei TaxID=231233 RepID=UPI00040C617D|nr:hypothetical protein [Streptococcus devriesei]
MAITPFDNSDYEVLISDLIADIYYSNISISSKIVLLRKLTELITRRFLNLGKSEKMELGDITTSVKNPRYKTTERLNSVDDILREDFEATVNNLREIGNKYSHTQNHMTASMEEFLETENLIWDLFSFLFIQYFLKYNLSLKSDKNVLSLFSQLPPEIRFRTLQKLLDIKGFDNVMLIDKYLLSLVKSRSWESAYCWLISNKDEISAMHYPTEEEIIEYNEDFREGELPFELRKFNNAFGLLSTKIRNPRVKLASGGIYRTFEDASKYYQSKNLDTYLSNTIEQIEFKELLYFCFIGRIATQ